MLDVETAKISDLQDITDNDFTDSINVNEFDSTNVYKYGKRIFDITASFIAIILLFPFMLILCIIIYIDDPKGSPIFKQIRCGKDGKLFTIYKFRSMCVNAEDLLKNLKPNNEMDGPAFKIKNDPRVTKVGRIMRATCIDELPQLFNVLNGDMSLVGPRPPLPSEVKEYTEREKERLTVIPGLTCYWQIQPNRNSTSFDAWVELDRKYIRERCFTVDLRIIFKTILVIFNMQGC